MKKKMNNKGFSLVELIIVIAIMAVLVAVLAPQYIKFVEKSRESTDLDNVQAVKTAIEAYVADKQVAPTKKFTVTFDMTNKVISIGLPDSLTLAGTLAEYGVAANPALKSEAWNAAAQWEYTDYKWTVKTAASATYLKSDGSEV